MGHNVPPSFVGLAVETVDEISANPLGGMRGMITFSTLMCFVDLEIQAFVLAETLINVCTRPDVSKFGNLASKDVEEVHGKMARPERFELEGFSGRERKREHAAEIPSAARDLSGDGAP